MFLPQGGCTGPDGCTLWGQSCDGTDTRGFNWVWEGRGAVPGLSDGSSLCLARGWQWLQVGRLPRQLAGIYSLAFWSSIEGNCTRIHYDNQRSSLEAGHDDVLYKPVTWSQFRKMVNFTKKKERKKNAIWMALDITGIWGHFDCQIRLFRGK